MDYRRNENARGDRARTLLVSLLLALPGLGCDPGNPSTTTETTGEGTTTATGTTSATGTVTVTMTEASTVSDTPGTYESESDTPGTTWPECYDVDLADIGHAAELLGCAFEEPCAAVEYASGQCANGEVPFDVAAAECVIESLQANLPRVHRLTDCPDGFTYEKDLILTTLGDGTVVFEELIADDAEADGRQTWRLLPGAAYFDACAVDTPAGLVDCLEGLLDEECQLGEPSCG